MADKEKKVDEARSVDEQAEVELVGEAEKAEAEAIEALPKVEKAEGAEGREGGDEAVEEAGGLHAAPEGRL